jgi:geranylgeranyl diphosphate synthase type II
MIKELILKNAAITEKYLEKYMKVQGYGIEKAMAYSLLSGGKRIRPFLAIEVYKLFDEKIDLDKIMPYACALEMIHTYSLIHDDLPCMDDDDYRRGKLTNHKVFGEANAVLAGDALLTYAPQLIIEQSKGLSSEQLLNLLHEYTKFAGAYSLIAGQVVDIESEGGKFVKTPEETLEFIHLNKTASLFRLAIRTGAIIANATKDIFEELDIFAKNFGLIFQIYDDIMDEIATFEELGKSIGKDKKSNKLTFVSLYGLDEAKLKFKLLIDDCYDIVNKYESKIFNKILEKLRNRVLGV